MGWLTFWAAWSTILAILAIHRFADLALLPVGAEEAARTQHVRAVRHEADAPSEECGDEPEAVRRHCEVIDGQPDVDDDEHDRVAVETAQKLDSLPRPLMTFSVGRSVFDHCFDLLLSDIDPADPDVNGVHIKCAH